MTDLDLFEQFLVQTRQTNLQYSHLALVNSVEDSGVRHARQFAYYAEVSDQLVKALRVLKTDPGKFQKEYLK